MFKRVKIESGDTALFDKCWELYIAAFPPIERRDMDYHLEAIDRCPEFHFEAILLDGSFVGIIGWWEFDSCCFIEHLATAPHLRGKGYGQKILTQFSEQQSRPIILEVEHPTESLSKRRIGFYERQGFHLNDYSYSHPSYHSADEQYVSLLLMSHPTAINTATFEAFKAECYQKVHFRYNGR